VREPDLVAQLDTYVAQQVQLGKDRVIADGLVAADEFRVVVRTTKRAAPDGDAALLLRVVAPDAERSFRVANTVRGQLTHGNYPGRKTTAGNLAFPLSKAFIPMGEAYVFNVWHLLPLDDPMEPFAFSTINFPRLSAAMHTADVA
jgi:hypothetical protein